MYRCPPTPGQSMRPLGKLTKGKMRIQKVSNMNIVWKYIEQTVKTVNIGPMDVVDGEPESRVSTTYETTTNP